MLDFFIVSSYLISKMYARAAFGRRRAACTVPAGTNAAFGGVEASKSARRRRRRDGAPATRRAYQPCRRPVVLPGRRSGDLPQAIGLSAVAGRGAGVFTSIRTPFIGGSLAPSSTCVTLGGLV